MVRDGPSALRKWPRRGVDVSSIRRHRECWYPCGHHCRERTCGRRWLPGQPANRRPSNNRFERTGFAGRSTGPLDGRRAEMGRTRAKLTSWNTRLWFGLSTAQKCQDIDVRILLPGKDRTVLFAKVSAALALIAQYSPIQLDRIRHDLRGIWITETAGNLAEYERAQRLCVLDR